MMHKHFYRFFCLLSIICFFGCTDGKILKVGECDFKIEEAHTTEERALGLMYRESISDDFGMLFFLGRELNAQSEGGFHMQNMNFPLDMVFISADKRVADIQTVPPCQTPICLLYCPAEPSYYVLEVNAGKSEKCNLQIGDMLDF